MKSSISGPSRIRQLNRTAVLSHIRLNGKNSRLQIGKELGLSAAAITSLVSELIEEGLLKKSEIIKDINKSQGRPISNLELNPDIACVFGLLLRPIANKCMIESAWVDYTGAVFTTPDTIEVETDNFQSIIEGIKVVITHLEKLKPNQCKVHGISIGIPGVVEDQTIPIAPKLECIENPQFITSLLSSYNYPISFENDVNLGAMAELKNQARLRDISFAYLHLYSGVGSSIVLDGNLLKGRRGWSGEIGQLKMLSGNKTKASFEQLLSVDGSLGDLLESLNHPRNELGLLVQYINKKNTKVLKVIDNYCNDLFNVINVLHSVIDLDEVIIDFPSTYLFQKLLPQVNQRVNELRHPVNISLTTMAHQAHLNGAGLNALNLAIKNIEKREVITKR